MLIIRVLLLILVPVVLLGLIVPVQPYHLKVLIALVFTLRVFIRLVAAPVAMAFPSAV